MGSHPTIDMSATATNVIVFTFAGIVLLIGFLLIQRVRNRIRELFSVVDDDEERMLNRHAFETTVTVNTALDRIRECISGYAIITVKATGALTIVVGLALLLTLGLSLANSKTIASPWTYAMFSLLAFLIGAVFSIVTNLMMFRLAGSSSAYATMGSTEGAAEGDAGQGFDGAFKRSVASASAISNTTLPFAIIAVMVTFHIAASHYELHSQDARAIAGVVAALVLGMSCISVLQGLQGVMVSRGIELVHERFEVDLLRRHSSSLQIVGTIVGDMVSNNMLFFPIAGEVMVAYLIVISVLTNDISEQAFALLPMLLFAAQLVVVLIVSILSTAVEVSSGKTIVRYARAIVFISFALTIGVAYALVRVALPESIDQAAANTTDKSVVITSVSRDGAFGLLVLGAAVSLIVLELGEALSTAQFRLTRDVAALCDAGAPATVMGSIASSNFALFATSIFIVATIYTAFEVGGFYGMVMAGIGSTIPLTSVFMVSFLSQYGAAVRSMSELCHMPHEVCEVADRYADRTAVVGTMASGYITVSSFFVSFAMVLALALYLLDSQQKIFSPHFFAFVVLGASAAHGLNSPVVLGITSSYAAVQSCIDAFIQKEVSHHANVISSEENNEADCVKDAAGRVLKFSVAALAAVIILPVFVGLVFKVESVVGLLLGITTVAYTQSYSSAAFGSTAQAVKQFVLKGGLMDASRFSQHHSAAVLTASIGAPMRTTNGRVLVALVKLMGATCIVMAPVFQASADS